ncbi:MAG TPA: sigma-54 dependent transcriptional regulator [Candidatus Hydrogenedens sp.]|nr:sigma-54 dependent transcriptional regulator [Candidatus Hydrogenedens sp.]HOL19900.1 sigma-54 dependent transcriptional regulator [Candidatus Hydrogenedens sp.]HPP58341.1 sigma-54 dependent transcriptional regulator [Candidatus Hydrogenedens sp.]
MPGRILVVDDERLIRWNIIEKLNHLGFITEEAGNVAEAKQIIHKKMLDLAIVDLRLPDGDGMDILKYIGNTQPGVPIIMITAYSSVSNAVEAMKNGAYDYISKPFEIDELILRIQRAIEQSHLRNSIQAGLQQNKRIFNLDHIIGKSPKICEIKHILKKVAESPSTTILLLGESGTGKDIAARVIHYESERAIYPFMNITCTALPETLLESELFGYERGAFTGADHTKKGLFELANNGTVFMDEIGDIPLSIQSKILRILEEKAFKRIGGTTDIYVDVRVIVATNKNLEEMVQNGTFREDLYYRLNVVPIVLPPLRERYEDIPLLAEHFLELFNKEFKRKRKGFSKEAINKLLSYHWPGNVRELRNVIERAVLLGKDEIIQSDEIILGRVSFGGVKTTSDDIAQLPPSGCSLEEVEKSLIRQALERTNWNLTRAGALLNITRDQVRYKAEKYGLRQENDK